MVGILAKETRKADPRSNLWINHFATIVYLEFENFSPHQNASLDRHKKLIDYKLHMLFLFSKVLLIFKRALRSRGQCPRV